MASVKITYQMEEAARLEVDLAHSAIEKADREAARLHFHNAVSRIVRAPGNCLTSSTLVSATLELSTLNFILGKGFRETIPFLKAGLRAAENLGDLRSRAMLKLHLARHYYFSDRRARALQVFKEGRAEAEALGDEDILSNAAEFIGLYYHIQGMFRDAITFFERAVEDLETAQGIILTNPSAPMWLGYCAAYLGQFHRAIGTLDYYRRLLIDRGDLALAATIRAVLGIILLELKKYKEAVIHLSGAILEAEKTENALALYFARGGMACHHFMQGRIREAHRYISLALREGASAGLVRQYASPIFLELAFGLYRHGLSIYPEEGLQQEVLRIMEDPNVHLRGVLLRLLSEVRLEMGAAPEKVRADLLTSEEYLEQSGTPVQLAKTRFALIRLSLMEGDRKNAHALARKAWQDLAGYGDIFFPDDIRILIADEASAAPVPRHHGNRSADRFVRTLGEIAATTPPGRLSTQLVRATNHYFNAERGAIFRVPGAGRPGRPELVASCNLKNTVLSSESFRSNLALLFDAHRKNRPKTVRNTDRDGYLYNEKAILCLPFKAENGNDSFVLYHDSAYMSDCFDFYDEQQLMKIGRALGKHLKQAQSKSIDVSAADVSTDDWADRAVTLERAATVGIIGENRMMKKIMHQIDQIAATDSNILILGETGVGKELVARRIHEVGNRRDMPLVVVDLSTIPENLVESELFGHEKGSFTGADRRKKGRLELAHGGTLFIDEIGEVPKSVQVKLLRAIQEKSVVRVGGTKPIFTDFRLIAATNRDLAREVASGRFREDLYYRLNVIPITVPPLRERKDDIIRIANHFLRRYAVRYNRLMVSISDEDKAKLLAYDWPGNVRELENIIERGVLLSKDGRLELDLPAGSGSSKGSADPFADMPTLDEIQRRYILHVLEKTGGKIGGSKGAAEILGVKRTSLYNKMKRLDIEFRSSNGGKQ